MVTGRGSALTNKPGLLAALKPELERGQVKEGALPSLRSPDTRGFKWEKNNHMHAPYLPLFPKDRNMSRSKTKHFLKKGNGNVMPSSLSFAISVWL